MRVQSVEAKAQLVDQAGTETVDLAGRQAAGVVLAVAIRKAAAIEHGLKRRGQEIAGVAKTEAHKEIVLLAESLVQANIEPVAPLALLRIRLEVVDIVKGDIGPGEVAVSDEACGDLVLEIRRNDIGWPVGRITAYVAADRSAAGIPCLPRIENLAVICWVAGAIENSWNRPRAARVIIRQKLRKVPASLMRTRNLHQLRKRMAETIALIVSEKERLVLHDGPAEGKAKLVLLVGLLSGIEPVKRVEFLVAHEFKKIAVKLIGAGLNDGVHDGAVAASEFGAVGIRLHLELGDGIHRGLHHIGGAVEHVAKVGVVVNAIEQEVVLQGTCAVGAEPGAGFRARARLRGRYARAQQGKLGV